MENALNIVKQIINTNIALVKKADPKKVKNIESFFEQVSQIPLIKLYTVEGKKDITNIIYNTDSDFQSEVLEFLLRIKPEVSLVENFETVCKNFLEEDIILDIIYDDKQDTKEFSKIRPDNISKCYVLNLILAYNTAI